MNDEYYILEGEEKTGPFSYGQVIEKNIDIHTQVATAATDKWQYASEMPEFNNYFASKGIYFPTVDNLAGFGMRALAFIMDYIPIYIIMYTLETKMGWVVIPANYRIGMPVPPSMVVLSTSILVTFLIYNTIFEATGLKGSLGKKLCRLSVVDINGQALSLPKALMRNVGVILSMTIWLPFVSVFFSEHRQAWYDSLTKAYIITKN